MIELNNIHKYFGERHILKGISLIFEQGKTNLIIGQSGSGKTVLLKSIVGLHGIDEGQIIYDGRIFSSMKPREKRQINQEMGMVFQGGALLDYANVEENVMFPMEMFTEMSLQERKERANLCLKRVNLENVNHLYPAEISGGMKKRVAIARAIALKPRYLFCDEPNSGLDPQTSIVIDNLIKELTIEYNMTTVINTHDMNSVMEIGDKVIFVYKGEKKWEGNNNEILKADLKELNEFIFASELMKKVKKSI